LPGLVGILSNDEVDEHLLDLMINAVRHQKSYKVDKYVHSCFGIGRVHLGIFNPEPQPILNEDESLFTFIDGKIYGYEKEKEKLKLEGCKFTYENDAEFCMHCYNKYGIDFVEKLNGSFVLIVGDLKENKIVIANDRYGLRPLYYTVNDKRLLFAQEVKSILEDRTFKKELDDEGIADFFAFGEFLGDKTFIRGVKVFPPGSIATYNGHDFPIKQYWDFNYKPDYSKSEDEFADELVKVFKKAVRIRMEDNFKYAVSLSGGLDSRSIIVAIPEQKKQDVLAITFGSLDCDEVKIAREVAEKNGIKMKFAKITPENIINNSEKQNFYSDGLHYPGLSFLIPVGRAARSNGVDIVFEGFALDLTLGGSCFDGYINTKTSDELFCEIYRAFRHGGYCLFSDEKLSKLLVEKYYNKIKKYPLLSLRKEFDKISENNMGDYSDHFFLRNHVRRCTIGGPTLLRTAVEHSVPTYDNDLIDLILKIPATFRKSHRLYRKFFKKLSPRLARIPYAKTMVKPSAPLLFWRIGAYYQSRKQLIKRLVCFLSKGKILLRDKQLYVDFNEWLRTNERWKEYVKELLLSEKALSSKYLNQEYIKGLIYEHEIGRRSNGPRISFLLCFELFLRFLKRYNEAC